MFRRGLNSVGVGITFCDPRMRVLARVRDIKNNLFVARAEAERLDEKTNSSGPRITCTAYSIVIRFTGGLFRWLSAARTFA